MSSTVCRHIIWSNRWRARGSAHRVSLHHGKYEILAETEFIRVAHSDCVEQVMCEGGVDTSRSTAKRLCPSPDEMQTNAL